MTFIFFPNRFISMTCIVTVREIERSRYYTWRMGRLFSPKPINLYHCDSDITVCRCCQFLSLNFFKLKLHLTIPCVHTSFTWGGPSGNDKVVEEQLARLSIMTTAHSSGISTSSTGNTPERRQRPPVTETSLSRQLPWLHKSQLTDTVLQEEEKNSHL